MPRSIGCGNSTDVAVEGNILKCNCKITSKGMNASGEKFMKIR